MNKSEKKPTVMKLNLSMPGTKELISTMKKTGSFRIKKLKNDIVSIKVETYKKTRKRVKNPSIGKVHVSLGEENNHQLSRQSSAVTKK